MCRCIAIDTYTPYRLLKTPSTALRKESLSFSTSEMVLSLSSNEGGVVLMVTATDKKLKKSSLI